MLKKANRLNELLYTTQLHATPRTDLFEVDPSSVNAYFKQVHGESPQYTVLMPCSSGVVVNNTFGVASGSVDDSFFLTAYHGAEPSESLWDAAGRLVTRCSILHTSAGELAERFQDRLKRWKEETAVTSSTEAMVLNANYQKIIGMGRPVVPLILEELRREPCWLFWALKAILDDDPVSEEDYGDLNAMAASWVTWGIKGGIIRAGAADRHSEGVSWFAIK